jgi:4-amino-4-deoxy-L-arabinose transferase-like glycosyltransferase
LLPRYNSLFKQLTLVIFLALLIPSMFQEGLFMDGLIYSTTAMNLAIGKGSFWQLTFTETNIKAFFGHPPLAIFLQSLFFKLLGSGYMVEKIYSLFTALLSAFIIALIWQAIYRNTPNEKHSWLPVLFWITIPLSFWSYRYNMLENTMGVFTLSAIYLMLVSINKKWAGQSLLLILSGLAIVAAFLSKGFPGLFPISFFAIIYFTHKELNIGSIMVRYLIILSVLLLSFLFIFQNADAHYFLTQYIDEQVISSISGHQQSGSHFFVLWRLTQEIMPLVILCLIIFFSIKIQKINFFQELSYKNIALPFLIGLSASLPIMISPKQLGFYLIPSLPFFALAFAGIVSPFILSFSEKPVLKKWFIASNIISIMGVVLIFIWGYKNSHIPERDKDLIMDVRALKNEILIESTIGFTPSLSSNWSLMGYLYRNYRVSLSNDYQNYSLVLTDKYAPLYDSNFEIKKELNGLILYANKKK